MIKYLININSTVNIDKNMLNIFKTGMFNFILLHVSNQEDCKPKDSNGYERPNIQISHTKEDGCQPKTVVDIKYGK